VAQFDIYPNPGARRAEILFLVAVQNDHVASRTGATVVIPLRANAQAVDIVAPLIEVSGQGQFVLSTDEIFAIDASRLKSPIVIVSVEDRAKIRPAVAKVIGEY